MSDIARAYTEVYEILQYLPEEEYKKIPSWQIDYFKYNRDIDYKFNYSFNESFEDQQLLYDTYLNLIVLYDQYIATPQRKEALRKMLLEHEEVMLKDIFKDFEDNSEEKKDTELVVQKKESFFKKIISFIKNLLKG